MKTDVKKNRKQIKNDANHVGWGVLIYSFLFTLIGTLPFIMAELYLSLKLPQATKEDEIYAQIMYRCENNGIFYIVGVTIGALLMIVFFKKTVSLKDMMQIHGKMQFGAFNRMLCIILSANTVFFLFSTMLEKGLNLFGYSAMEDISTAGSVSATVSMFIYSCFIGPIVEELLYRGLVLHSFRKYGKIIAITISALLFGIMHANIPQAVFAFCGGLILGYIALEYSIFWSIALHIINNCIFGDALGWVLSVSGLSVQMQYNISNVIFAVFFLISICILWKERNATKEYFDNNKTEKGVLVSIMSATSIVIFILVQLALAITKFQKI